MKALWDAADKLTPTERDFTHLLMLLCPRKTALAHAQRSHLNLTAQVPVWTTPNELTKSKPNNRTRTYRTPLPALALSIFQQRLAAIGEEGVYLFPGALSGIPFFADSRLVRRLVKAGAPKDFSPHQLRHTVASWMEDNGASLYERGLVLNHSEGGTTSGYSHGFAGNLKLTLLATWEAHRQGGGRAGAGWGGAGIGSGVTSEPQGGPRAASGAAAAVGSGRVNRARSCLNVGRFQLGLNASYGTASGLVVGGAGGNIRVGGLVSPSEPSGPVGLPNPRQDLLTRPLFWNVPATNAGSVRVFPH